MAEPKEPLEKLPSGIYKDVNGKFWWVDETENWGHNEGCATEADALRDARSYAKWLEGGDLS